MQTRHWRTEFRVGDRRVLGIADGVFTMTDDFMIVPGYQHRFDDATGRANLPVGCFLVEGDRTVLIDAGLGPFATENLVGGDLLDELAAIGVQPADVDIVAVSHRHLDHDGWIATRDAGLTFPNATVHVGRRDHEHFVVSDPDGLASELGVPARGRRAVPPRWLPVTGARPVVTTGATATGECDHRGTKRAPTEVDVTQASGPSGSGWTALSAERDVMGSQQGNDTSAASSVSVAPNPLSDTFTSLMADGPIEVREGYADVGDQTLHYVEAGDGPLLVLLHGFPEFWFGWRLQIQPLAAAGFRVVAPDTRGYNLSSKPEGFEAYGVDLLADDIRGFIGALGAESAHLVGHDWGGSIAWTVAMNHPEVVDRLAILNAAHPRRLSEGLHHPSQLRKSWYFFFFATPGLPEDVVHARDWHFFRHFLQDANPPYTQQEIERYIEAWSQPGAAAGMINYYRASVRQSQKEAAAKLRPLSASTLVIWGENDSYLGSELAEPDREDVPNLDRVERLPDASHWVHHDQADRVNQLLIDFFH